MTETVVALLQAHPWLPWAWLAATLLCTGLRAGWPREEERPRWCVVALAVLDVVQANPSGFLKPVLRRDK